MNTTTPTATPAQVAFIRRLTTERDLTNLSLTARAALEFIATPESPAPAKRVASQIIDQLLTLPYAPKPTTDTPATPGYYVRDGEVFVVVNNKAGTHTYAKHLAITTTSTGTRARWEYAPGVGRSLAADHLTPLTVEEASRLGHLHGICVVCTRQLTDPKSVQAGIGPVCATRLR